MVNIPKGWKEAAVAITCGFEVAGDPYEGVSGDFDGMGISCGALQWNIGSNSLQPMVKKVGKTVVLANMPKFGQDLWDACNTTVAKGLKIVRAWQANSKLPAKVANELKALMGSADMRAQQDARIDKVAETAFTAAADWAVAGGGTKPSKRLFCWFFDLTTQNGTLKGITFTKVDKFIKDNKPSGTDDVICDFLVNQTGPSGHIKDANKNGAVWRNKASGEKLEILCLSYLRSLKSIPKWSHVVLNRKGSITMGGGWVNGEKRDFAEHGL